MKLNGITFNWTNNNLGDAQRYGFLPEELQKIFPTMVISTNNYNYVYKTDLIPVLVEAVKELNQKVNSLL